MHLKIKKTLTHQKTTKQNIPSQFRPVRDIADYESYFIDPQCQPDPYSDDDNHNHEKLVSKHNSFKQLEQTENDDKLQIRNCQTNSDTHWSIYGQ